MTTEPDFPQLRENYTVKQQDPEFYSPLSKSHEQRRMQAATGRVNGLRMRWTLRPAATTMVLSTHPFGSAAGGAASSSAHTCPLELDEVTHWQVRTCTHANRGYSVGDCLSVRGELNSTETISFSILAEASGGSPRPMGAWAGPLVASERELCRAVGEVNIRQRHKDIQSIWREDHPCQQELVRESILLCAPVLRTNSVNSTQNESMRGMPMCKWGQHAAWVRAVGGSSGSSDGPTTPSAPPSLAWTARRWKCSSSSNGRPVSRCQCWSAHPSLSGSAYIAWRLLSSACSHAADQIRR
jgi:hypothetical protein